MGTLFLVATPIGNLEDITARAVRVLGEVRLVAAEDTRQTRKLLSHLEIHTPLTSYYEHNKLTKLEYILGELEMGDVALVSDAGTPGLNDPGYELVQAALAAGHAVSPVPGPNAPVSALVASGLPTDRFLYLGYLPRKSSERRRLLEEVQALPYTLVFLETPHRLAAALQDLHAVLGDRSAAVARELTKLYEEIRRDTLGNLAAYYQANPPRGEITLVVAGASDTPEIWPEVQLEAALQQALEADEPPSQAAGRLAAASGWPRRVIYRRLISMQNQ
ncbi:MAG: 16S rRNA (cytidine(1402)-2'-O)-methyltransferase [Anaerolineales bacterium]|jgi:16S rRNA (cytidine1402-2'-O)-methyltransferase